MSEMMTFEEWSGLDTSEIEGWTELAQQAWNKSAEVHTKAERERWSKECKTWARRSHSLYRRDPTNTDALAVSHALNDLLDIMEAWDE